VKQQEEQTISFLDQYGMFSFIVRLPAEVKEQPHLKQGNITLSVGK
jgi:hypothetical protein